MSYDTYEEFDDTMTDILSSGQGGEVSEWHEEMVAKLFEGMDRDSVLEFANLWYGGQDPTELIEGELSMVAELLNNLDVNAKKVVVESKITFS